MLSLWHVCHLMCTLSALPTTCQDPPNWLQTLELLWQSVGMKCEQLCCPRDTCIVWCVWIHCNLSCFQSGGLLPVASLWQSIALWSLFHQHQSQNSAIHQMSHHHFAFSATEWCLLQWIETFAFHHQLLPFFMTKWITSGPHQMVPTSLLVRCRDSSNSSLDSLSNNHSTQMVLNVMSHLICIIIHKLIPVLIQLLFS